MLKTDEEQIRQFHEMGYSCYALAKKLGLDYSTVKKYCREHDIHPQGERKTTAENRMLKNCELCGKLFVKKKSKAKFCSDACRQKKWLFLKEASAIQESEEGFLDEGNALSTINITPKTADNLFKKPLALSLKKSDELVERTGKEER